MAEARAQWKSKLGFILAASGSAIGLGNIVFFPANAYKYGGGAFYLPYLIALFVIGIPVMITEFGLGSMTKRSFPLAMRKVAGRGGEFLGWFAIMNAGMIAMYYVTILGWVIGMMVGAIQEAWFNKPIVFGGETEIPWFGGAGPGMENPLGYFLRMISGWEPVLFVVIVWLLNGILVSSGARSIEKAVKVFVPLMWIAMLVLVYVGLFELEGGIEGVKFLFTPQLEVLKKAEVWQGAMGQMFFTLTLGFGVMTAYASYLPRKADHSHNAITTSLLNCGFEWIAGVAIFSILFAFSITPKASSLTMMFNIVPKGIASLPWSYQAFGIGFFFLLLIAGLTSSISLVEALVSAAQDKFRASRGKTLAIACAAGALGSFLFALPKVVNPILRGDAAPTLGLALLDLTDHWAFGYGLLIVGLIECLVLGWGFGARRIREHVNLTSRLHLGAWFDWLIKAVIPALILFVLVYNILEVEVEKGLYGLAFRQDYYADPGSFLHAFLQFSPWFALIAWIVFGCGTALLLTVAPGVEEEGMPPEDETPEEEPVPPEPTEEPGNLWDRIEEEGGEA